MRALVIGATGGIGRALAAQMEARGAQVTALSRKDNIDLLSPMSFARHLGWHEGPYDWLWIATGALGTPEKATAELTEEAMLRQFRLNAMGPALLLRDCLRMLPKDRAARIGVLSARLGSIGDNALGGWHSYRAAKAALNQYLRTIAIELRRSHPQAVLAALHPGTVDTAFTAAYDRPKLAPQESAEGLVRTLEGLRPEQSGGFFAWDGREIPW